MSLQFEILISLSYYLYYNPFFNFYITITTNVQQMARFLVFAYSKKKKKKKIDKEYLPLASKYNTNNFQRR